MALSDDDRARSREPFFANMMTKFVAREDPVAKGCQYDLNDALVIARTYFVLNGVYKRWRLNENRNTKFTKIAGLKMAAIMAIRPFTSATQSKYLFFVNPSLSFACAEDCLGPCFLDRSQDSLRRLSVILDDLRFPFLESFLLQSGSGKNLSIAEFLSEIERSEKQPNSLAQVEACIKQLDLLVTICELAVGNGQ